MGIRKSAWATMIKVMRVPKKFAISKYTAACIWKYRFRLDKSGTAQFFLFKAL